MENLARPLVIAGLVFVLLGLLFHANPSIPVLGKLPGDLTIERSGFRLYLPITSCILVSVVLSFVFWLFSKLR